MERREQMRLDRDELLEHTEEFEKDLERILKPWAHSVDPVTDRLLIAVEGVTGAAWGRRLRFYNGHFIEFAISQEGSLSMWTSADNVRQVFDAGMCFRFNAAETGGTFVLETFEQHEHHGIPLSSILDEHIAAAINLPELIEDSLEQRPEGK